MSAIGFIISKQDIVVRIGHYNLGCRRSGINTDIYILYAGLQRCSTQLIFWNLLLPFFIALLTGKDRHQAAALIVCSRCFSSQLGYQIGKSIYPTVCVCRQRRSGSRKQRTIFRQNNIPFTQMQILHESLAQSRNEGKRTSTKQNRRLDIPAVSQRNDGLDSYRMKNRSGNIFPTYI